MQKPSILLEKVNRPETAEKYGSTYDLLNFLKSSWSFCLQQDIKLKFYCHGKYQVKECTFLQN